MLGTRFSDILERERERERERVTYEWVCLDSKRERNKNRGHTCYLESQLCFLRRTEGQN